jgi:hypothetical protein
MFEGVALIKSRADTNFRRSFGGAICFPKMHIYQEIHRGKNLDFK